MAAGTSETDLGQQQVGAFADRVRAIRTALHEVVVGQDGDKTIFAGESSGNTSRKCLNTGVVKRLAWPRPRKHPARRG